MANTLPSLRLYPIQTAVATNANCIVKNRYQYTRLLAGSVVIFANVTRDLIVTILPLNRFRVLRFPFYNLPDLLIRSLQSTEPERNYNGRKEE